jgi:hypothetical protein
VISNRHYTKKQWQDLDPSTMVCAWHDRQLFVFHSTGCLIFRFDGEAVELTTTDDIAESVYVDQETDSLYYSRGGGIYQWEGGSTNRTATYKSGHIRYPTLHTFSAVRVDAEEYPVTVNLYRKDKPAISRSIPSNKPVNLPRGSSAIEWEGFEIISAYQVAQLQLATSRGELDK